VRAVRDGSSLFANTSPCQASLSITHKSEDDQIGARPEETRHENLGESWQIPRHARSARANSAGIARAATLRWPRCVAEPRADRRVRTRCGIRLDPTHRRVIDLWVMDRSGLLRDVTQLTRFLFSPWQPSPRLRRMLVVSPGKALGGE